jgi:demethylmenaquinone methyltransferase/2-methoxy-6-polyprenyl-1,4-benzoquinol methylase
MTDAEKIRSMFAAVSRRYDLLNHLLSLNRDKSWRKNAVAMSGLAGGERILDVCSGTADLALTYADGVGPEGLVFGTDFCPEMLVIGKAKVDAAAPEARVELMVADTIGLPFPDDVFDVVSVGFGIRNVPDYEAGIREMARVAKAGGRVVILEFSLPENGLFGKTYMAYFTRALPVIGRLVSRSDSDAYDYLPNSVLRFPSGAAMLRVMEDCGLTDVSAKKLTLGIVTVYVGHKR